VVVEVRALNREKEAVPSAKETWLDAVQKIKQSIVPLCKHQKKSLALTTKESSECA